MEEGNGNRYRLSDLERRVLDLERVNQAGEGRRQQVAINTVRLDRLEEDVEDVRATAKWIIRTLVALSVTIIGGVLVYALANGGPGP